VYLTYTRHRIRDYDVWRKAFDDNTRLLKENGIHEWFVTQVNDDPTDIAVLVRYADKAAWDSFVAADQEQMKRTGIDPREKGGVVGDVEWWTGEER
jgi:heme-degrading monooxygenase HmoA